MAASRARRRWPPRQRDRRQHLPYRIGVAKHSRGEQAAPGDTRIGTEDVTSLPKAPLDHRAYECLHTSAGIGCRVDSGLEPRPARKPQLAGDDQLCRGQTGCALERPWVVAAEPLHRRRITAAGRIAQLLGLAAQLVEIGALGKRTGHGVSLLRLRSAAQAEEEATVRK